MNTLARICLLAAWLGIGHHSHAQASRPPNIVILLSDDQGWGDLSLHGNRNLSTPNLDQLARAGAQFAHFYVQPVCSPTRAELLTGRYHIRSGVHGTSLGKERMSAEETTLADYAKRAGYATGIFGKWHSGMQWPYHPNARGFDEFYGFSSGHWADYFSPTLEYNGKVVKGNGYVADDFTDKALAFMEAHRQSPFLVYIPFNTPHSPMQVPDAWWDNVVNRTLPDTLPSEDRTHTRAALAMCENLDWNVGRVLAKLEALGLTENTIVVFFNDNGPNGKRWNGGMRGIKGSTDEGGVRSPLFIRYPKAIRPNTVIQPIASAIDLLPTLLDLASVRTPLMKPLDGRSLRPLLVGGKTTWPERTLVSYWSGKASIRSQRFRLDADQRLYDMVQDPAQTRDVSAQFSEETTRLKKALADWKADVFQGFSEAPRPYTVGHPKAKFTELPARDAVASGSIKRSSIHPNSSFFTHWTSTDDLIEWPVEVIESGEFEVEVYYTCPPESVGTSLQLEFGNKRLIAKVEEAFVSELRGASYDRSPRTESYMKDFKPLRMGRLYLPKGTGTLRLRATQLPGPEAIDFRTLLLVRP